MMTRFILLLLLLWWSIIQEAHSFRFSSSSSFGASSRSSIPTTNINRHLTRLMRRPATSGEGDQESSSSSSPSSPQFFVGFDLGTSGARISVMTQDLQEVYTQAIPWSSSSDNNNNNNTYDDPAAWMNAVETLLTGAADSLQVGGAAPQDDDQNQQPAPPPPVVAAICVSGTSASCLLIDGKNVGKPTRWPRMYNYDILASSKSDPSYAIKARDLLDEYAPDNHTTKGMTSALAKLLAWNEEQRLDKDELVCHQSDYVALRLMSDDKACGSSRNKRIVCSDWHNCLKLGYDVQQLTWPSWLLDCLQAAGIPKKVLPANVVSPGSPMGTVSADMARKWQLGCFLSSSTVVVGGTTDSNAAFFAATGSQPSLGTAVTSLGSTLALKQLSKTYVEDASLGVYSHRFPSVFLKKSSSSSNSDYDDDKDEEEEAWLVGGASNVGCAVLRQEKFSNQELDELSQEINPSSDSPISYYPLTNKKGERFPVADSNKEAVLTPVPDERREYLHGILQGISDVERDGYLALGRLGASPQQPTRIWTCGGGSRNEMWSNMRQRRLRQAFHQSSNDKNSSDDDDQNDVVVAKANNVEASYGAAILAASSFVD